MKKLITILLLAFIIVGCKKDIGTPENAAEKYLSDLSSDLSEFGFYNAHNHDNRSLALMIIDEDFYIGFRAKYIVKGLRVCLDYPEDMDAIFTCRGTHDDFEDVKKPKRCIEKKYEGVILPRQGYIFVLRTTK